MPANTNQRGLVILLSVIAVMLALIIGVMIYMFAGGLGGSSGSSSATSGMGASVDTSGSATFDPATATKVPDGMTQKEFVVQYHEYVVAKDYAKAYALLPAGSKAAYGSESAFAAQLTEYNVTGYEIGQTEEAEDTYMIAAAMKTSQVNVAYVWTFKQVDGQWYAAQRDLMKAAE